MAHAKVCEECKTDYVGVRSDQKFCTVRCRTTHNMRAWRSLNPAKVKAGTKARYARFKERDPDGELARAQQLKTQFGLSTEDYQALFVAQAGACAICGLPETAILHGKVKRLSVDHCHATGKVRGLLCGRCNVVIGLCAESPDRLDAAAQYLRTYLVIE